MATSPQSSPPPKSLLPPIDYLDNSTFVQYPRTEESPIQDTAPMPKEKAALVPEQNSETRRMDILRKRIMAISESEREMKALLRTLRDTNADLDKTIARVNESLGRLEFRYKVLARRKANGVVVAKGKR